MFISKLTLYTINIALTSIGGLSMGIATYRYHRVVNNLKQATYNNSTMNFTQRNISLVLIYSFIIGYLITITNTITHELNPMYTLTLAILFIGSFLLFFIVNNLRNMEKVLKIKNMEVMKTFVNNIELKDSYTKGHSKHVYDIVRVFYNYLNDSYKKQLNKPKLMDAAMLHDIGKICIKDEILNKKDKLTQEEWDMIRKHPLEAKRMLDDTYFKEISDWVFYHHERMDGNGYYSLKPERIPLASKIIAIADTYSALCTNRSYREKIGHNAAVKIMQEVAGQQFDSNLLDCFLQIPENELAMVVSQ
ncbi:HD domain-containing protein [Odoribacter sp. OttesenSCG-928-A06]|nr:HD domain-containing protein [Odoribacter sp. OttesenSCG-928-A06]